MSACCHGTEGCLSIGDKHACQVVAIIPPLKPVDLSGDLSGPFPGPKAQNPKDLIATASKIPMALWPATATAYGTMGMLNGKHKYGRNNFRASQIAASVYVHAAIRHILAWFEGRECDPADGVPDLGAALACLAIIVDAKHEGTLVDDRNYSPNQGYLKAVAELEKLVPSLAELHKERHPKDWTKADEKK